MIEKAIADNAEWKRKVAQICTIKGVGLLTVANLITETNEFALFDNQRQLVSYSGYDVVENQSGKRAGRTRISKRGNSRIRRALHMSALQVVRYDQKPFVGLYKRVFERTKIKPGRRSDEGVCSRATETADDQLCFMEKRREIRL